MIVKQAACARRARPPRPAGVGLSYRLSRPRRAPGLRSESWPELLRSESVASFANVGARGPPGQPVSLRGRPFLLII